MSRSKKRTPQPEPLSEPLVSLIIPTYNRPAQLLTAVRSALKQQYKNLEVVVVNDAGQDVSEALSAFSDPRLVYLNQSENRGLSAARNAGLRAAKGDYLGFLDDDDWLYPEHVRLLMGIIRETGCCIAYSDAHRVLQETQNGRLVELSRDVPYSSDFDHTRILVENFIPVLCHLSARECFEGCLFDESYDVLEDWDWLIRVSFIYHPVHVHKLTCAFSARNDGSSMSSQRYEQFLTHTRRIYLKYAIDLQRYPQVAELRDRMLTQYGANIAQKKQMRFILGFILSHPDPLAAVRNMNGALDATFAGHAYHARQEFAAAGDEATAKTIDAILQLLAEKR